MNGSAGEPARPGGPPDFASFFRGKTVTLMGLGLLGRGVGDARFLAAHCDQVLATDLKSAEQLAASIAALEDCGNVAFHLGEHPPALFTETDMVIKAAGVPLNSPQIALARAHGIPVYMSTALFALFCPTRTIGVTGTRGKSTTTQMIFDGLVRDGRRVILGGNVRGVSTLALLPEVTADHDVVLELDSWQLQGFDDLKIAPSISVFTTFLPDHMNYYEGDLERYLYDKLTIFRHQRPGDVGILSSGVLDQIVSSPLAASLMSPTRLIVPEPLTPDIALRVPGRHNRLNAGLALAALTAAGVSPRTAGEALSAYTALEGRLQLVAEHNGLKFYNDSNATTQDATLAALQSFPSDRVILIFGGADKGLPIDDLLAFIGSEPIRCVALAGTGTDRMLSAIPALEVARSMPAAVAAAVAKAAPGDIVVLSPGFASFGLFQNEYDRSDQLLNEVAAFVAAVPDR